MTAHNTIGPDHPPVGVWAELANCRTINTNLFYSRRYSDSVTNEAKAVCAGCVVKTECLDYALTNEIFDGVWGGTDYRQREFILTGRPRRRQRLGDPLE
jgi:WhiB family redox-sensing transcriptional regulator